MIEPVDASMDKPAGAENVPPEVPTRVTFCTPAVRHHDDPVKDIIAEGNEVIVIGLVAVTTPQPPAACIVLVTVYVPAILAVKFT